MNKKQDEFVDEVAKDVLKGLSREDKDYIYSHPDSTEHHFGIGLWIRNKYIHGKDLGFDCLVPDDLSSDITSRIASYIIENYDYENLFYRYLYDSFVFSHLRRLYFAIYEKYPDALMEKYAEFPDAHAASKEVKKIVRALILNARRFKRLCKKYGLSDKRYKECKTIIDSYNKDNWDVVPYDIVLLASRHLEPEYRQQQLQLLGAVLKQTPRMALQLPAYVFNQKDAALIAVGKMGVSLKRFSKYNADDEIIRAALLSNGEAIQYVNKELRDREEYLTLALSDEYGCALKMRCMAKYRDNEDMVRIALTANGRNIEFASDRLRDDLDTAKYAVTHQKVYYPESTVCNLSFRLRDNLEIALLDIHEGHACVGSYSRRLRDCEEVAEALIETDKEWKLYMMSKRIQKKNKCV